MTQPDLFDAPPPAVRLDPVESDRRKADGMARVDRDAEWKAAVLRYVQALPGGHEFTSDDVMARVGPPACDPRAMGPAMRACAGAGLCMKTGAVRASARPTLHSSPRQVWRRL